MRSTRQSLAALVLGFTMLLFASAVPAAPVNINTADAATIAKELKGIGLKRAQAIVEYRQKHGPFRSADELAMIKGIGPAVISKNRELITTDGKAAPAASKPAAAAKPASAPAAGKPAATASQAKPATAPAAPAGPSSGQR